MNTKIPVYRARVTASKDDGIYAMSFVDFPAVERNFIALNKRGQQVRLNLNRHKQVLTGVVLIPDQLIYRDQAPLGQYYMQFTAADIEQIAAKMMRQAVALSTTTHQHDRPLKGNHLVELWIVKDPKRDKSVALGMDELPVGTLCASYKIGDANYWKNEVLTGNVTGFSLEGFFNLNNVTEMKKVVRKAAATPAKKTGVSAFLRSIATYLEGESTQEEAADLETEAAKDETDAGTPYLIFTLDDSAEVWVDSEGYATIDGENAPAGEHLLDDGSYLVIDDDGKMVVTAEEVETVEVTEAELSAAKRRAKAYLKANGGGTSVAAENARLKRELAKFKKSPSTTPVRVKKNEAQPEPTSATAKFTSQIATQLTAARDRKAGK